MKTVIVLIMLFLGQGLVCIAQVGISNDNSAADPSAGLDIKFNNKGILPPRLTTLQRNGIGSPATGLLIYNIDCNDIQYYNSTGWIPMSNSGAIPAPGLINGNLNPCKNSTGNYYTIGAVANATGYHWTVPPGAVITAGQGTTAITASIGSTGGVICAAAYNDCYRSTTSFVYLVPGEGLPVGVSITAAPHPDCSNTSYTFIANPLNGGPNPVYQWVNSYGSWQSTMRDPVIYPGECGYGTDIFYLTNIFAPPSDGLNKGVHFIDVEPCFQIGQSYGGGVIFYLDNTSHHGLVAATADQSTGAPWGCTGVVIGGTAEYSLLHVRAVRAF